MEKVVVFVVAQNVVDFKSHLGDTTLLKFLFVLEEGRACFSKFWKERVLVDFSIYFLAFVVDNIIRICFWFQREKKQSVNRPFFAF